MSDAATHNDRGAPELACTREQSDALIAHAAQRLLEGDVLAIKGLGGWHLACDATNEKAVAKLRERKHRPTKPLAVMMRDLQMARAYAQVDSLEAELLGGNMRPIVLLIRRDEDAATGEADLRPIASNVAGELPELGVMLPSTPVQHLLLHAVARPLVMTSGNRSGEPIVADDAEALEVLAEIADGFLGNNRRIVARYDDSVVRVVEEQELQYVRRARGYAPAPLFVANPQECAASEREGAYWAYVTEPRARAQRLQGAARRPDTDTHRGAGAFPGGGAASEREGAYWAYVTEPRARAQRLQGAARRPATIFAAGPEQKSTLCFLQGERAYISQHLGDLERLGAWQAWEEARVRYARLFDLEAQAIACDMHPEYLASKWARDYAREHDVPLVEVQHHHAHIASVLGENALEEHVIGVAIDGTGYGMDGSIWGCEVLLADRAGFERFWHAPAFRLPGGAAAIKNPRRSAYAMLRAFSELSREERERAGLAGLSLDNPQWRGFLDSLEERALLDQMLDKDINSPVCTSLGRLFDGVAALLGLCTTAGYDGEPACLLEAAARRELRSTPGATAQPTSDTEPLTAAAFHANISSALVDVCERAREASGINRVALSGGCMVNRLLAYRLRTELVQADFEVYENRELPPNDGCISYGQAIVARSVLEQQNL